MNYSVIFWSTKLIFHCNVLSLQPLHFIYSFVGPGLHIRSDCMTSQIARKADCRYSRTSFLYKYKTSTLSPFVKPCDTYFNHSKHIYSTIVREICFCVQSGVDLFLHYIFSQNRDLLFQQIFSFQVSTNFELNFFMKIWTFLDKSDQMFWRFFDKWPKL